MEAYQSSQIVFIYDDISFSLSEVNVFLNHLLEAIDKNKKGLLFTSPLNESATSIEFKIENKYYACHLKFIPIPLSKIKETKMDQYEGVMILLTKDSLTQKIFEKYIIPIIPSESKWSSCMVLFKEIRDDLCELSEYSDFVGLTIDNHFEIICDCANVNDFNDDDGIGTINTALQSVTWSSAYNSKNDKKTFNGANSIKETNKQHQSNINADSNSKDTNNKSKQEKEGYEELKEQEIYEQLLSKVKDIKALNSNSNLTDQERRANAEKAMLLMAQLFDLDEEKDSDQDTKENEKDTKPSNTSS